MEDQDYLPNHPTITLASRLLRSTNLDALSYIICLNISRYRAVELLDLNIRTDIAISRALSKCYTRIYILSIKIVIILAKLNIIAASNQEMVKISSLDVVI